MWFYLGKSILHVSIRLSIDSSISIRMSSDYPIIGGMHGIASTILSTILVVSIVLSMHLSKQFI